MNTPVRKTVHFLAIWSCCIVPLSSAEPSSFRELVTKVATGPSELVESIERMRLREDLEVSGRAISQALRRAGMPVILNETSARRNGGSPTIRVGIKYLVLDRIAWLHQFSDPEQKHWADIVRFSDAEAARDVFKRSRQLHSGTYRADYFAFFTISSEEPNGISILVLKDEYLVNIGRSLPFALSYPEKNPEVRIRQASELIDGLLTATEALARAMVSPDFLGYIPKAHPTQAEVQELRVAGFAQMWSAVKQNFVFLHERPNLDWEAVLPLYLPRVARTGSHEEYIGLLKEALALLEDGHTGVTDASPNDIPALRIESVEGRPVVTEIGDTQELAQAGMRAGAEILEVDGVPIEELLEQRLRRVSASTAHDRLERAYRRLLQGPPGEAVTVRWRNPNQEVRTIGLARNLQQYRSAARWLSRPLLVYEELESGIAYVALNSFQNARIADEFDRHFDHIAESEALILDVRENGGGSTENGYAVIARLIEKPINETAVWRTRLYRPTFQAWSRPREWHEEDHGEIQPRGASAFTGPVAVLIGPRTFSAAEDFLVPLKATKRAVLVGRPTGGSTGQPILVRVYGATVAICTKWDRFPDGTEFVGVGVQPDIRVERTIMDVARGSDPVLEAAVAAMRDRLRR